MDSSGNELSSKLAQTIQQNLAMENQNTEYEDQIRDLQGDVERLNDQVKIHFNYLYFNEFQSQNKNYFGTGIVKATQKPRKI